MIRVPWYLSWFNALTPPPQKKEKNAAKWHFETSYRLCFVFVIVDSPHEKTQTDSVTLTHFFTLSVAFNLRLFLQSQIHNSIF